MIDLNFLRLGLVVLGLTLAAQAAAQDVSVRSADHLTFTRVVVDFEDDAPRDVSREGERILVRSEGGERFELDGVYRRIPRERVARIVGDGPGQLVIELACDCPFESFRLPNGGLVIDVADPGPNGRPPAIREARAEVATPSPTLGEALDLPPPPTFLPGLLANRLADDSAPLADAATELRASLSEQFARGAAQGLIRAAVPSQGPADADTAPAAPTAPVPAQELPNLRVQTQVDRDSAGAGPLAARVACLPEAVSDVTLWGDGREAGWPSAPVDALYDDVGRPVASAHATRARTMLYLGFGAEARALLPRAMLERQETRLLDEIARVLDGETPGALLSGQADCDSFAGLLAILDPELSGVEDPDPALRRLADLPRHLRDLLGPRVAERLARMGATEAAITARNSYARGTPPDPVADAFAADALDRAAAPDATANRMRPVVETRAPRAAEAMRVLIAAVAGGEGGVPSDLLEQARALAFEAADPDRAALEAEILRAGIAAGRLAEVADEMDALARAGRGPFPAVERLLFRAIAALPSDAAFLRAMVPLTDRPVADDDTRLAIATRLADLRLMPAAERVIDASGQVPVRAERVLRARIAAEDGKARIAESYITGLEGPEIAALRTELAEIQAPPASEAQAAPAETAAAPPPALQRSEIADGIETLARSATLRDEIDALLSEE
ncbi:hypothetical protein [Palleronia pelagia]|uniref:HEAT repeat-containing protein n=1 Tax=Palleronia pelagia TaxID=387096 RepID=A0A1H8L4K8_9RHOB|nr:hypothetical protein [Palleronia pelagia]SEO00073.1 hypothetical protein SAMN04488011_10981 [Palleronia pelagia]